MGMERYHHLRLARVLRGGRWGDLDYLMASPYSGSGGPSIEDGNIGFRVASVPEPSCMVLTILASGMLVTRRKR